MKKATNKLNTIAKQRIDQLEKVVGIYQKLYVAQSRIYTKHLSNP